MDRPSLYLASICYGGLASADFMRSVLALRAACSAGGIPLQLDLMGGEALASRGEAMVIRRFVASEATHLLFLYEPCAFDPQAVIEDLAREGVERHISKEAVLLDREAAAAKLSGAALARFGDLRGPTSRTGSSSAEDSREMAKDWRPRRQGTD